MKMPKFEADLQNKETIDYPKDAVGYTVTHPDGTLSESFFTVITDKTFENDDAIFLYTHPAKTLTDEEIRYIWQDCKGQVNDLVIFARAILKKASEK